jgi:hypothetical protein
MTWSILCQTRVRFAAQFAAKTLGEENERLTKDNDRLEAALKLLGELETQREASDD